tara:strand:+ start:127 stop:681 length:555 start_codon:yes stop_codon:yes gene_type:complete
MEIKVIDNFANIQEQLQIINLVKEKGDQYQFTDSTVFDCEKTKFTVDYPCFAKLIFASNPSCKIDYDFFPMVYYLLHKNKLSNYFIERIKINVNFPFPNGTKENHGPIHQDFELTDKVKESISIIYYINNSDGDSVFFDKKFNEIKRVSPRQGRAVIFNNPINHAGSCPVNSPYRQAINFILYR